MCFGSSAAAGKDFSLLYAGHFDADKFKEICNLNIERQDPPKRTLSEYSAGHFLFELEGTLRGASSFLTARLRDMGRFALDCRSPVSPPRTLQNMTNPAGDL
jgi:hypothetical protein